MFRWTGLVGGTQEEVGCSDLKETRYFSIKLRLRTNICLKDRDCFNNMRILGQKSKVGLEPKKKKNEEIVKITFTPDRDLDDYLRSKNLLEEKQKKVKEPKNEEEKKEAERRRALNIAALLSWNPDEPLTSESSDSQCNGLECHNEIEMNQNTRDADEKCSKYNNNEMTEVEIEAAYEDLCAEMSQEYVGDKGKGSFWPNSLQNKFSRVRNIDAEFSKMEREEERRTMAQNLVDDEFTRMEDQTKLTRMEEQTKFTRMEEQTKLMRMEEQTKLTKMEEQTKLIMMEEQTDFTVMEKQTEFKRMEEQEDEEWSPSSPTEEWIGVVVQEVR